MSSPKKCLLHGPVFRARNNFMAKQINVKKLRTRLNLTQTALADLVGVNQSTIARIENDGRPPSKPVLKLLEQIASDS